MGTIWAALQLEIGLPAVLDKLTCASASHLDGWNTDDLHMVTGLIVNTMVTNAAALVEAPADRPWIEAEIVRLAEKQLRLVMLGIPAWRSETAASRSTLPA